MNEVERLLGEVLKAARGFHGGDMNRAAERLLAAVRKEIAKGKLGVLGAAEWLAEADMLRGEPVTGAHKRGIHMMRERLEKEAGDG